MPTGRKLERAVRKQDRGYPQGWEIAKVDSANWVSQFDAVEQLGVLWMRVALWISSRRLVPAHNSIGQAGVTRESVESVLRKRLGAGRRSRCWQFLADMGRSLVRGI